MADSTTLAPATNGTTSDFVSQLVPAICQVFFVIALGYLLGALNIIPVSHAKPLSRLCGVVLLPTAVFVAMLTLEGGTTAWKFLAGIVIAKVVIFVLVLGLGLAVDRTPQRYGQAAIRAIFCTQSNDFAFGLPIFQALFLSTHPGYSELLYIVAPISLVLLNPIGFGLMEFSRQTNDKDDADAAESAAGKKVLCKVLSKVSRDPLVIFTFLGIIGRLLFWATDFTLPVQVQDGLEMIGAGFTPVALFCLGLVCVGKFKLLTPTRMPLIAGLMLVKSLVAPVLCKLIFSLVFKDDPDLGNAAFIYGAIPTATGVFTYCTTYGMPHETIAVSMVLGTIVAAPIMLIFGFVLASASDPTSGLNSTSAAMDSAYLQEFPAMISILGCMYLLVVAAIFYRKMDLSRRALWSFLISAGVVGIVQCTAAFIDNLNCLTVNSNASTMGGYLNIWEQTAVILRVWAISQHRILVAAFGLLHLFLYGPGGLAKYPTRTGSEAQRVLNKKKNYSSGRGFAVVCLGIWSLHWNCDHHAVRT